MDSVRKAFKGRSGHKYPLWVNDRSRGRHCAPRIVLLSPAAINDQLFMISADATSVEKLDLRQMHTPDFRLFFSVFGALLQTGGRSCRNSPSYAFSMIR